MTEKDIQNLANFLREQPEELRMGQAISNFAQKQGKDLFYLDDAAFSPHFTWTGFENEQLTIEPRDTDGDFYSPWGLLTGFGVNLKLDQASEEADMTISYKDAVSIGKKLIEIGEKGIELQKSKGE